MQAEYWMMAKQQNSDEDGENKFPKKVSSLPMAVSSVRQEGEGCVPMIDNTQSACWWVNVCNTLTVRKSLKFQSPFRPVCFQSWNVGVCLPLGA
jgi:hypothetical protein